MAKLDVEKLIKVVGLLASDHDGERSCAARMASDLLKAYGLTWEDVFRSAFQTDRALGQRMQRSEDNRAEAEAQAQWRQRQERDDVEYSAARERYRRHQHANPRFKIMNGVKAADVLRALKVMPRNLADWDIAFIDDILRRGGAKNGMTEKQWNLVFDLANKAGVLRRRAS